MAWGRCAVPGNSWRHYCAKKESMGRYSCKKRESERNQGSYSIMWLSSGTESQLPIAILVLHMSGFQYAVSKFHAKIQVRVSSCNFQVSSFKPRSRSGFQVAISKFQISNQGPGQGFKLQFENKKTYTFSDKVSFTCIGPHFSWFSTLLRFFLFLGATSKIVVLPACELNSAELK